MDLTENSPCIIGSACRLPGGLVRTDEVFSFFDRGDWQACSTQPPASRGLSPYISGKNSITGRGGWLGERGVELFDAAFFGISPQEAVTLRPNVRLALELTIEALENAGIPPTSLRGKNVSVSIGVGTEDGWDIKRVKDDGVNAFDQHWACSSDPSGIAGRIAHVFDFRGPCNTVSNACASGAFALRDGINALFHDGTEVAIVGSLATHCSLAPFGWAFSTGVASRSGRSSAFSPAADGYSPSEGAVFFVLKRQNVVEVAGDHSYGTIRAFGSGHGGATRSIITPNSTAQAALTRKVLEAAKVEPTDVVLLEAHGTGTLVGDALEAEGIRSVYHAREDNPLILSSSKTILGHCHGSAALVGMLKVLSCFEQRIVPPHHVTPHLEFRSGSVIIPVQPIALEADRLIAQVNAFGFTGSITTIILESAPQLSSLPQSSSQPSPLALSDPGTHPRYYLLPFSAKSESALLAQMRAVSVWAMSSESSLADIALILGLCRDHYKHRRAILISTLAELVAACSEPVALHDTPSLATMQPDERITIDLLNLDNVDPRCFDDTFQEQDLTDLEKKGHILEMARILYERGHTLSFSAVYNKREVNPKVLRGFPVYQFDRRRWWKDSITDEAQILDEVNRSSLCNRSTDSISLEPDESSAVTHEQILQPSLPSPVFVFGPWSALSAGTASVPVIEKQIMTLAQEEQNRISDTPDVPDVLLDQQLKTLAYQMNVVGNLSAKGITPGVVLGYCFGEYAAAVTAGIITLEVAVNIIVRRAVALRGVKGAMLNVFCDLPTVRRCLVSLTAPPNVAISVGPEHIVLSGTYTEIKTAEAVLHRRGVKTLSVATSLPFHSTLMASPAAQVIPLQYTPVDSPVRYISGITGTNLPGRKLGLQYWLRHMREPLNFYRSMQFIHTTFPREPIVDIGPGVAISKIIKRYDWSDMVVVTPEEDGRLSRIPLCPKIWPDLPMSSVEPGMTTRAHPPTVSDRHSSESRIALDLLASLFGYDLSAELLSRSLHSIGLQSMDFIRFSESFTAKTGIRINFSAFVSDAPLEVIIDEAKQIPPADQHSSESRIALDLLASLFGYDLSTELLSRSLHSIGLQSMDFIRFSDSFTAQTGIRISFSAFVSDASLGVIVDEAKQMHVEIV